MSLLSINFGKNAFTLLCNSVFQSNFQFKKIPWPTLGWSYHLCHWLCGAEHCEHYDLWWDVHDMSHLSGAERKYFKYHICRYNKRIISMLNCNILKVSKKNFAGFYKRSWTLQEMKFKISIFNVIMAPFCVFGV